MFANPTVQILSPERLLLELIAYRNNIQGFYARDQVRAHETLCLALELFLASPGARQILMHHHSFDLFQWQDIPRLPFPDLWRRLDQIIFFLELNGNPYLTYRPTPFPSLVFDNVSHRYAPPPRYTNQNLYDRNQHQHQHQPSIGFRVADLNGFGLFHGEARTQHHPSGQSLHDGSSNRGHGHAGGQSGGHGGHGGHGHGHGYSGGH